MKLNALFYQSSFERIRPRLEALDVQITPILLAASGEMIEGGAEPDIGWVSPECFIEGNFARYMKRALAAPALRWLQSGAAGYDGPAFAEALNKGVRLSTNKGSSVSIAEYVLGAVLDHFHGGPERRAAQHAAEWKPFSLREIGGTHWLIIGFGSIGQEVARRAKAFGCRITGVRRDSRPHPLADQLVTPDRMPDILPTADVVVLSLPLNHQTADLVNRAFLNRLQPTTVLVNVGRGGLVDEAALLEALDAGAFQHAILDVFKTEPLPPESPFWHHPRVTLTAHLSGMGSGLTHRSDDLFITNLQRFLNGEPLLNEVDAQQVGGGKS